MQLLNSVEVLTSRKVFSFKGPSGFHQPSGKTRSTFPNVPWRNGTCPCVLLPLLRQVRWVMRPQPTLKKAPASRRLGGAKGGRFFVGVILTCPKVFASPSDPFVKEGAACSRPSNTTFPSSLPTWHWHALEGSHVQTDPQTVHRRELQTYKRNMRWDLPHLSNKPLWIPTPPTRRGAHMGKNQRRSLCERAEARATHRHYRTPKRQNTGAGSSWCAGEGNSYRPLISIQPPKPEEVLRSKWIQMVCFYMSKDVKSRT